MNIKTICSIFDLRNCVFVNKRMFIPVLIWKNGSFLKIDWTHLGFKKLFTLIVFYKNHFFGWESDAYYVEPSKRE